MFTIDLFKLRGCAHHSSVNGAIDPSKMDAWCDAVFKVLPEERRPLLSGALLRASTTAPSDILSSTPDAAEPPKDAASTPTKSPARHSNLTPDTLKQLSIGFGKYFKAKVSSCCV